MDKYTIAPPAGSTNNSVGAVDRPWQEGHFNSVKLNGGDVGSYLAESTGYGIVSGCEPSISGLTVTVGAGIVHLADGTRKELSATNITLDNADGTNPRIDLVYINADGVVAKVTGTAAASPSAPVLPVGGIKLAEVYVTTAGTTTIRVNAQLQTLNNKLLFKSSRKLSSQIGVSDWAPTNQTLACATKTGFGIVRVNVSWPDVEQTLGVRNYSTYVNFALECNKNNVEPHFIFSYYPNSLYGMTNRGIINDTQRNGYAAFAAGLVQSMIDIGLTGLTYELWNEPNVSTFWLYQNVVYEQYTLLAQAVYASCKAVDPTMKLETMSMSDFDPQFFNATLMNGIAEFSDAISFHCYQTNGTEGIPPENRVGFDKIYEWALQYKKLSDKPVDVNITEFGYSTTPNWDGTGPAVNVTDAQRAKYLPRCILYWLAHGFDKLICYKGFSTETSQTNIEAWFGIYRLNGDDTLTSLALQKLFLNSDKMAYVGVYYHSKTAFILQFVTNNGDMKYIGWSVNASESVNINGKKIMLTDAPDFVVISDNLPTHQKYITLKSSYVTDKTTNIYDYNNTLNTFCTHNDSVILGNGNKAAVISTSFENPNVVIGHQNTAIGRHSVVAGVNNLSSAGKMALVNSYAADNQTLTISYLSYSGNSYTTTTKLLVVETLNNVVTNTWMRKIAAISGTSVTLAYAVPFDSSHKYYLIADNGINECASILGSNNINASTATLVIGNNNIAAGERSLVIGRDNELVNQGTVNDENLIIGTGHIAQGNQIIIGGRYSNITAATNLLVIGNGTDANTRSNAFRVNDSGVVYGQGAYNSGGADYAEYFEWSDGNADSEDRVGYFVTLDGDKIRIAKSTDTYILGIVSGNASVIGNSHNDQWHGMYMRDDFGRLQYNDNGILRINPHYDNRDYVGREKRKEWSPVGMLGVLPVRDDGTCEVNGYCKVVDGGIATKATSGYRVLERVSDNVIKIVFR